MSKSKIDWTDRVWNPVTGCSKVSEGCRNCYAIRESHRMAANPNPKVSSRYAGLTKSVPISVEDSPYVNYWDLKVGIQKSSIQWTGEVFLHEDRLIEPLHWKKPSLVFVNSMSDLFHENIPFEFIIKLFCTIEKSSHTFQILTKRQDRMLEFFTSTEDKEDQIGFDWPLPNVWIGVSCEDQKTANERIPVLLEIPAEVRFVSLEPLLGSIDLSEFIQTYTCYGCGYRGNNCDHSEDNEDNEITCPECGTEAGEGFGEAENDPQYTGIDWVIIGAESGCAARPMELDWARSILDQCKNADVPFFMKQLCNENGRKIPFEQWPEDLKIREYPLGNRIAG